MRIFKDFDQQDLEESQRFFQAICKWLDAYSDFSDDNEPLIDAINDMKIQYEASESEISGEILERQQDTSDET